MFPVLLNIGSFQISSFGFFLTLGIFLGGFTVWRVARGYEFEAEKILDLSFLTIGFGFIASRLVYILTNLIVFDSITKILFLNKYPGLSLWGGLAGGLLVLFWFTRKSKISFLQGGDFGMVGFLLAGFFAEIGCLLGSCGVGIESNLFFAVPQEGLIGKRLPIQFFEALIFLIAFWSFWKASLKFHLEGSLFAKGLMLIGFIKFIALIFKSQTQHINILNYDFNLDLVISAITIGAGLRLYYQVYRKTPIDDLESVWKFLSNRKTQSAVLASISKGWYNQWVNFRIGLKRGKKRLFKLLNIRPNPENF